MISRLGRVFAMLHGLFVQEHEALGDVARIGIAIDEVGVLVDDSIARRTLLLLEHLLVGVVIEILVCLRFRGAVPVIDLSQHPDFACIIREFCHDHVVGIIIAVGVSRDRLQLVIVVVPEAKERCVRVVADRLE